MDSLPCDHVPSAGRVGTAWLFVRLLPGVGSLMRQQVVRPAEDLSTHSAGVGLDSFVKSHVLRQHVTARETLLAHITEVSFAAGVARLGFVSACHVLC